MNSYSRYKNIYLFTEDFIILFRLGKQVPIMIIGNAVLKSLTVKYFKINSWRSQGLITFM